MVCRNKFLTYGATRDFPRFRRPVLGRTAAVEGAERREPVEKAILKALKTVDYREKADAEPDVSKKRQGKAAQKRRQTKAAPRHEKKRIAARKPPVRRKRNFALPGRDN